MIELKKLVEGETRELKMSLYADELEEIRTNARARQQTVAYHLYVCVAHWFDCYNNDTKDRGFEGTRNCYLFCGAHQDWDNTEKVEILVELTLPEEYWARFEAVKERYSFFEFENIACIVSRYSRPDYDPWVPHIPQ